MKQYSQIEKQESPDVINYQIRACEKCRLPVTRKHALTGERNLNARNMFITITTPSRTSS